MPVIPTAASCCPHERGTSCPRRYLPIFLQDSKFPGHLRDSSDPSDWQGMDGLCESFRVKTDSGDRRL